MSEEVEKMSESERIATAYHEAGHAVVALALGKPIHKVTISPNRDRVGMCQTQKGHFRPSHDQLEDAILILFAGYVAEARFTGQPNHIGATSDFKQIRRLSSQRADGERQVERLEKRLLAKTEYMLEDEEYWGAVERIAKELVVKETISGRAAKHFFDQFVDDSD